MLKFKKNITIPELLKIFYLSFILFNIFQCIYSAEQMYPDAPPFINANLISTEKKRVSLVGKYFYELNGKPGRFEKLRESGWKIFASHAKRELESTGLFFCTENAEDSDYKINLDVYIKQNQNSGLFFLSSITLLLIPATANGNISFVFTVQDKKGNKVATIEKAENSNYVQQLFLLFYLPFDWHVNRRQEQENRLMRSAISDFLEIVKKQDADKKTL